VEKVDTGSALVHRYDGALAPALCRRLRDYIRTRPSRDAATADLGKLPWHDSDTYNYAHWEDAELRGLIGGYRIMVAQLICLSFGQIVFPHFTDLVLWRPGKKMGEHKDDGYPGDNPILKIRHFSAVTYCNDDYGGGETFIRNEHGGHYVATPRTGTLVFYPSDERAAHGVNEVTGSERITLSTWFTRDFRHYVP
jgi:hypothetical protein